MPQNTLQYRILGIIGEHIFFLFVSLSLNGFAPGKNDIYGSSALTL